MSRYMKYTYTLKEIPEISKMLVSQISKNVVLISGDMGAGKTTLINAILKELGVSEFNGSPTYSIVNEYRVRGESIYHFDLFRINNTNELYDIGIEEYLSSGCWSFIEWPDKLLNILPSSFVNFEIKINQNESRTLKIKRMN